MPAADYAESMLTGIALIAAGVAMLLTAKSFFDEADRVNEFAAREARQSTTPRILTWVYDLHRRWGAAATVWVGRVVAVAAIVVGVFLVVRA